MAAMEVPLDDKARRTRDLLASFYAPADPSSTTAKSDAASAPQRTASSLDAINTPSFDPHLYMNLLVQKSNLEQLLRKHVEMAAEIKNLDTDLQMLVYENYNKFISATDTIKRMKNNIVGMETNMEQLLEKILSVQSKSDGVNTSLFEKREHIEKLHRTRNLLRKVQFIYDLPVRLGKCIKFEAYADAVRFFTGAKPIFEAYGDSSFQDCKKASEEAMGIVIKNLQEKLLSDSEHIETRAEAVVLLSQLNYPVDSLKMKLLEKLEDFLTEFNIENSGENASASGSDETGNASDSVASVPPDSRKNKASMDEFSKTVHAYQIIFPDSEKRLIEVAHNLFNKYFDTIRQQIKNRILPGDLLVMLRIIWKDAELMDEVLPEAALPVFCLEAARGVIKQYIDSAFSHLLSDILESMTRIQPKPKDGAGDCSLQIALETSKKAVIQGSMDLLLDFCQLLDDNIDLLLKLRDLIIDWVQEGFQDFFRSLDGHFLMLAGKSNSTTQESHLRIGTQGDKVPAGLVLLLVQISIFIEQSAIPRITEEIAASFSGGGVRGYEYGPAFVPGEICRIFRAAGENFLHLYINMKTQKTSTLLKKRFTTPNWIKHKEPREVHMFVDLLLQELEVIGDEVKQIFPHGINQRHHRSESTGSTNSSRSNTVRDDRLGKSNTQRARSQLLESHLAKLFEQKMEIFTKVEYTQESIVSTIIKLCLKGLQEFVRLQTFNRSGYQQIQLDIEYLKNPLKDIVEDEAAIDFLLKEVINAAHERCLDPIPLEPAILDRLISAKLKKSGEQNPVPQ